MSLDGFRKINVDQYDEDRVLEHELYLPDPRQPAQVLSDTNAKATAVRQSLQRGDTATALHDILDQAPYGEGVDQAKAVALQAVLSILNSTKSTDITALIEALDSNERVTLMKYLYKAMENLGETSGNVVLGWHEKLVEAAGTGCIVRVMTDRRRV